MPNSMNFHLDWWMTAADKCPVAVAFINEHGNYSWTNLAFSKLLGWSKAEILGKHWTELTPLTEIGEGQESELRGRSGELQEVFETKTLKTKVGTECLVSIYAHRFPPYGEYQGWIMFITDAGATKESVDALRREYVKLKGIVEGIQTTRDQCQVVHAAILQKVIEEQKGTSERLDELLQNLAVKNSNGNGNGNRVNIGGDYSGRDKTNTPTIVLMWVVIAAVCLGVASMGARLMIRLQDNGPNVTVEQ